jgi:hypothetical protein
MQRILPYIIVFFGATASAALVMAVLFLVQPDLLVSSGTPAAVADSTRTAEGAAAVRADSLAPDTTRRAAAALPDTTVRPKADGDPQHPALADVVRDTAGGGVTPTVAPPDSGWGKDQKAMAKVFESMEPASAARIMRDIPDDDVRRIILTLKKRQAAKILSALDPDRAARIMR